MDDNIIMQVILDIAEAENKLKELRNNDEINMNLNVDNIQDILQQLEELRIRAEEIRIGSQMESLNEINEISRVVAELSDRAHDIRINVPNIQEIENAIPNNPVLIWSVEMQLQRQEELENDIQNMRAQVEEIRLNPENFSPEEIENVKNEMARLVALSQTIYFGNERAAELRAEIEAMGRSISATVEEGDQLSSIFGSITKTVTNLGASLLKDVFEWLKNAAKEGSKLNMELEIGIKKIKLIWQKIT
jgi:hypothetical protein